MPAQEPLVTINLPSYNHEAFIGACLDSILAQTYRNFQVLVTDDCSTDGTLKIAEAYAKKHPDKIKVHPNSVNQGIAKNFSRGLKMARGTYFINFNSDDIMLPQNLEKLVEAMEAHPEAALCHSNVLYFDSESGEVVRVRHKTPPLETTFRRFMIGSNVVAPSAMMRRSMTPAKFPEEPATTCDWPFFAACLKNGTGIYINEPLIKYRAHAGNTSGTLGFYYDSLKAVDWIKNNLNPTPEIIYGYGRKRRILGKHLWRRKKHLKALGYISWGLAAHLAYIVRAFPRSVWIMWLVERRKL